MVNFLWCLIKFSVLAWAVSESGVLLVTLDCTWTPGVTWNLLHLRSLTCAPRAPSATVLATVALRTPQYFSTLGHQWQAGGNVAIHMTSRPWVPGL